MSMANALASSLVRASKRYATRLPASWPSGHGGHPANIDPPRPFLSHPPPVQRDRLTVRLPSPRTSTFTMPPTRTAF
jgi:hypothetical protein